MAREREWQRNRTVAATEVVHQAIEDCWARHEVGDVTTVYCSTTNMACTGKLVYLNVASPQLLRAAAAQFAYEFTGAAVNDPSSDNIGICIGPCFGALKGKTGGRRQL